MKFNEPLFFERNRVNRVYTGGKLFGDFFGDEPVDGFLPEEWIASNVKAINKIQKSPKEGISKIKGTELYLDEALSKYSDDLLGNNKYRILVKALDSAIRLPAQAHPDKAFSRKYFNSDYGKTECWIILDTRPEAKIYFGFKDGVTKEMFEKAIDQSEYDKDAMERLMCEITPKKGDVFLVPGKTVHAIGKGCLILEIQEPTYFTIQPERFCGDYKLNDNEMYLGLTKDVAVSCFNFGTTPKAEILPQIKERTEDYVVESLICNNNTDCFEINRIILNNSRYTLSNQGSYAVYIVTDGTAEICGVDFRKDLRKGNYFFMPASLMNKFSVQGNATIIECF